MVVIQSDLTSLTQDQCDGAASISGLVAGEYKFALCLNGIITDVLGNGQCTNETSV